MNSKIIFISVVCFISWMQNIKGQENEVIIDPGIQKYIGGTSLLDRSKYFNMHATWSEANITDEEYADYTERLRGGFGRGFWGPFAWAKNKAGGVVGKYPDDEESIIQLGENTINYSKSQPTWERRSRRHVVVEHPENVIRWSIDKEYAANWAAQYFKYFYTEEDLPLWYEPMNEPFVHAGDDVFAEEQPDDNLMRQRMAEWFAAIGKKFDETPELQNVNVIGYSSAWPSMELWDFGHWNTRMKMFMDIAGPHMDAFSTHLYDGINVTGSDTKRSGSNSEAILDLIETYSFLKWGIVKPHAITEFGGIESGYPDEYSDVKSVQSIKSINHILFNLLNRENDLQIAIPFIGSKAIWHITEANNFQPYGSVLWRPEKLGEPIDENTKWVYTPRVYFYELWKDVEGYRIYTYSSNPDIQIHGFVSGNKLFVALNNLDESERTVSLNFNSFKEDLQSLRIKRLKIFDQVDPEFSEEVIYDPLEKITLIEGETVILEYLFDSPVEFNNSIVYKKYYANKYLQQIIAPLTFHFSQINLGIGAGNAFLRMSIARAHNLSKKPIVKINGNTISVPDNWAGYDQANRELFFGMIRIPVPFNYLKSDNIVEIKFPDTGGYISSLILEVGTFEKDTDLAIGRNINYDVKVLPINDNLEIILPEVGIFNKLNIFDMNGRVLFEYRISGMAKSLLFENINFQPGTYVLRLSGPNQEIFTKKIVLN